MKEREMKVIKNDKESKKKVYGQRGLTIINSK